MQGDERDEHRVERGNQKRNSINYLVNIYIDVREFRLVLVLEPQNANPIITNTSFLLFIIIISVVSRRGPSFFPKTTKMPLFVIFI